MGDFVRIVKKEKAFGKIYNQSFTDEVFEIKGIPILSPPTLLSRRRQRNNQRKVLSTRITDSSSSS